MTQAKPILRLKRPPAKTKGPDPGWKPPSRETTAPPETTDAEFLAELQGVAPDLFDPDKPVPLAIGIHKQLYPVAERMKVSRRSLRRFLSRWTASGAYQRAMSEPEARRVNLDGSQAGEVSEQHGDRARQRVAPH